MRAKRPTPGIFHSGLVVTAIPAARSVAHRPSRSKYVNLLSGIFVVPFQLMYF